MPFELLVNEAGRRLLETHIVSDVPSGSVLTVFRERQTGAQPPRAA